MSLRRESMDVVGALVRNIPGEAGILLRRIYWNKVLESCGLDLRIGEMVFIDHPENVVIGDRVRISRFCMIQGSFGVRIGDDVMIGPYSMLESEEHIHTEDNIPISLQGYTGAPITLERGCWIGMGASILCGVTIGSYSRVGAGAVVTRDVEPGTTVVGVPARPMKKKQPNSQSPDVNED